MIRKRTIATMAALGGMTATVALLAGLSAAKADELADLRANQQLLQQRLDQLAQAPITPAAGLYPGGPPNPAYNAGMVGGSFPRSFLIPGTDTSLRVGGQITEIMDYWFQGGPANTSPQTTTVSDNGELPGLPLTIRRGVGGVGQVAPGANANAVGQAKGNGVFSQTPKESKLNVETRTPTAWGEARTFMEFDWAGSTAFAPGGGTPTSVSDNLVPRLKFAYGTLGGFLGGQANSNFSDPDANGETLDFGGNMGEPGHVRIPQIRYTTPLAPWGIPGALSVSAETPETEVATLAGIIASDTGAIAAPAGPVAGAIISPSAFGVTGASFVNPTKASSPDLTAAWYIPQPWGHVDFSTVLRPTLELNDGAFVNRTYMGWGFHFGGDVKPGWFGWAKDDIIFQFTYGDGIGSFLNGSSNFSIATNYPAAAAPATAAAAASVLSTPTVEWGGELGYQHWWMDNLRSNINAGINHHDIPTFARNATPLCAFSLGVGSAAQVGGGDCGLDKELVSAHLNLIWNPVPFVDVAIEYFYGHRLVVSNLKGDQQGLISKFAVRF